MMPNKAPADIFASVHLTPHSSIYIFFTFCGVHGVGGLWWRQ